MKKIIIGILLLSFSINTIYAQVNDVKLYAFGHSLIDHRPPAIPTPNDETTVFHWMHDIAQEAEKTFAGGGQYGFLSSHVNLPPTAQWGYDEIPGVWWDEETETFADANINTVLLTVANFIQYTPASGPYPLDESTTAVALTETIFDWVHQESGDAKFYIYLNWPEMDLQSAYPPTPPMQTEVDAYHNWTTSSFTDWWVDYQDDVLASRPELNTRLIPVGTIISKILRDVIPNQIPFTELYEDSAPHGRATLYFMAGMITYMAVYQENIPATYAPDDIVHQGVRDNLATIKDFMWAELLAFNLPNGESRVFCETPNANINLEATAINLFPNPSQGAFTITGVLGDYTIEIIDATGNIYQTIDNNTTSIMIDINDIPEGLYFIQVKNHQNDVLSLKRIIKVK